MHLVRRLTYHSAMHNYVLHAVHIPGVKNNIADSLSRYQMTRFRKLAPEAELFPTPCVDLKQMMMT